MNTYDVSVKGRKVLTEVASHKLEDELKILRGIVWTTGGSNEDIQVTINNPTTT